MSCLFCDIISKQKSGYIVYEDEHATAILDVFPRALGHVLVLPKRHMETILEMQSHEREGFWGAVQIVTEKLKHSLNPAGFTIGINHGKVSGQVVEHLHVHIIPRFEDDGGGSIHSVVDHPSEKTLTEVLALLQK